MRKIRIAAAGVIVAALASAAPAMANAPQGNGHGTVNSSCGLLTVTSGSSIWVGEQHYLVQRVTFTNGPDSFTKESGNKNGLSGDITCTGSFIDPEFGLTSFNATLVTSK